MGGYQDLLISWSGSTASQNKIQQKSPEERALVWEHIKGHTDTHGQPRTPCTKWKRNQQKWVSKISSTYLLRELGRLSKPNKWRKANYHLWFRRGVCISESLKFAHPLASCVFLWLPHSTPVISRHLVFREGTPTWSQPQFLQEYRWWSFDTVTLVWCWHLNKKNTSVGFKEKSKNQP